MKRLHDMINQEGIVLSDQVLKVDAFLNHQVDPTLMWEIAYEFMDRFQDAGITRILTIEAGGIAPAMMTALRLGVPMVYARKTKSVTLNEGTISAEVFSFTKQQTSTITVAEKYLQPGERVLIIDDFLANGKRHLVLLASLNRQVQKLPVLESSLKSRSNRDVKN